MFLHHITHKACCTTLIIMCWEMEFNWILCWELTKIGVVWHLSQLTSVHIWHLKTYETLKETIYDIFSIGVTCIPHQCQEILRNGWMSTWTAKTSQWISLLRMLLVRLQLRWVIRCNCSIDIQGAAERSPLFGTLINSKPKKIRQMFFYFWKVHRMPF